MGNNANGSSLWNERSAIHYRMGQLQDEMNDIRDEYKQLFDRLRDLDGFDRQLRQQQYASSSSTESSTPKKEKESILKKKSFSSNVKPSNKSTWTKKEEIKARKELVVQLLKEDNMRAKDISKALGEKGFKVNNLTTLMSELGKEYPEIQRIERGVYGWVEEQLGDADLQTQIDEKENVHTVQGDTELDELESGIEKEDDVSEEVKQEPETEINSDENTEQE